MSNLEKLSLLELIKMNSNAELKLLTLKDPRERKEVLDSMKAVFHELQRRYNRLVNEGIL